MTFNPEYATPAGEYSFYVKATDSEKVEIEKTFKLTILEDGAYDESVFFEWKVKSASERLKDVPSNDNEIPLTVKIKEITADGIVKLEWN